MFPVLLRFSGPFLLLFGLLLSLLMRNLPPASILFWFIPTGLFFVGALLTVYTWRWLWGLSALLVTGLAVSALNLPLWLLVPEVETAAPVTEASSLQPLMLQVPEPLRHGVLANPPPLQVLKGLNISVFAAGLQKPRMLAFSPTGELYVSLPSAGQVAVLPDLNRDGVADAIHIFASGLDQPHGLAFDGKTLLVAETGRLIALSDQNVDLQADRVEVVSRDLPAGGGHWTRTVEIGSDGAYYVSVGSSCNACAEEDPRRATILKIDKAGGPAKIYARGLRNSVGLARHPQTGELWASNNGRDMLGDDLPPEELNLIVAGADYGWPYCYGQKIPDPDFDQPERCRDTLPPLVEMPAHSAPLGIAFGQGLQLLRPLQQMLFVAFHGSWNRSIPTGYKLVGIPFENGRPSGPPQDIVRGWLQGYSAWGRPVAPAVGPDGALYLSDDRAGVIYRITRNIRRQ